MKEAGHQERPGPQPWGTVPVEPLRGPALLIAHLTQRSGQTSTWAHTMNTGQGTPESPGASAWRLGLHLAGCPSEKPEPQIIAGAEGKITAWQSVQVGLGPVKGG